MTKKPLEKSDYPFTLDFKVRDYECDIQGIVNNSVYQNYLEHTRHEFLASQGFDFHELCKRNINLVVVRIESDYIAPLQSGDEFWVGVTVERKGKIRGFFNQDVVRNRDGKKMHSAKVFFASIDENHRPFYCEELEPLFQAATRL